MYLLNLSKLAELRAAALFDIKDEVDKTHPMTCTYLADAEADIGLGSSLAHGGGLNSRLTARQVAASSLLMELGKYHRLLFAFDDSILRTHDSKSEEYLKYFNAFETREFTLIESLNNYLLYIEESLSRPFALNLIKDNATPVDPYDMDITHPMAQADNAATVENIFIAEPRLNELISLNVDKAQYNARPQQQQRFQEDEILRIIKELGFSANAIPKRKAGRSGVKADVRKKLSFSVSVFDKAWERLRANNDIQDEK